MEKIVKNILLLILILIHFSSKSQTLISGKVKSKDGLPLPGVSVKIKGVSQGASTDTAGNFQIKTQLKGSAVILASAISYATDSLKVFVQGSILNVNLTLKENNQELLGVQIQSRRNLGGVNRELTLPAITIAMTAGAAADVTAALQTFPGAAPAGNETGFFVHGGSAAETAVVFDGLLVKNAFGSRLPDLANRSRFSAFIFDKTTFSTNGFNAEYGEALSSVLSLNTNGLAHRSSSEFAITSLGGGAARTQRFKNSSITIGANYYNFAPYNSLVKQNTLWQKDPQQYNATLNYKYQTSKTGMLKAFVDYSDTQLSFDIKNPNQINTDLLYNRNKNIYFNTNYQDFIGKDWKIYAGIGYNKTQESGDVNTDAYYQNDDIWQEKIMLTKLFSEGSTLNFGIEQFQNKRAEGYAGASRAYSDILSAGFAESQFYLNDKWSLKTGLRAEYSTYLKRKNLAPRTALIFLPGKQHQLTLSYGTYYQKPDESFLTQTAAINYEKQQQYALDYEWKLSYRLFKISAYYKDYQNLVKITTPVFSGFQAYGPPLQIFNFNNQGNGYAKGIDVFWKDKSTFPLFEYYISYSYVDTKRNYIDYPAAGTPSYAPPHTFNVVMQKIAHSAHWFYSATYTYSTGRNYFNPLNSNFMGNQAKDAHNLSLGLTHILTWKKGFPVVNLNFNNVLGFKNVYGYRYSYDGSRRESILPPARRSVLLSFLCNIDGDDFNH